MVDAAEEGKSFFCTKDTTGAHLPKVGKRPSVAEKGPANLALAVLAVVSSVYARTTPIPRDKTGNKSSMAKN